MSSRLPGWGLQLAVYVVAGLAAWGVAVATDGAGAVLVAGLATVAAAIAVFAFSCACRNASLFDPFWSVAPIVLVGSWAHAAAPGHPLRVTAALTLVGVWGLRLTYNFFRRWRGLGDEDWRYEDMQVQYGGRYWLMSFIGIHVMPACLIFAGSLPVYVTLTAGPGDLGVLDGIGLLVASGGIAIEAVSDRQLRRHLVTRKPGDPFLQTGLWAWSRHPNYVGEIAFWWGLGCLGLGADAGAVWALGGAAGITLLFVAISVPLMERRAALRPGWQAYAARTPVLMPRPPRRPAPR